MRSRSKCQELDRIRQTLREFDSRVVITRLIGNASAIISRELGGWGRSRYREG
jgi:hypothetical protein